MATNNINNVLIRASNTSGVTPSSLAQGTDDTESTAGAATEIAINRADGKLFYLNDSDTVTEFTQSVSGNTFATDLKIGRDADNLIDFTTDNDIIFRSNGADSFAIEVDGNGHTNITNINSDKDVIFKGNDGGVAKTALTLDMSASGKAIFNDTIEVGDNVNLKSDGAVIGFGADGDVTLEHQHNTGIRLNGSMQLQFNDADSYIFQSSESFYIRGHNDMYFNIDTPNDSTARHFIWRANTSTELMRLGEDKLLELKGNMIVPDGGNIGSASDADAITILGSGNVEFSQDVAVDGNLTIDGNLDFAGAARHIGDTDTNISFTGADTISIQAGGAERVSVNQSGMAIGTGARVTEIENNDSLGTSDTKLCTQGNVKAYVDTNALSLSALSVGSEGTASGDGAIAYNNSTGVFTYTPPLHDSLSDFVSNEHINHANVTLTAGDGLTGGGTIAASRTFTVVGGDGITANANDVAITAAQTTITSVLNDSLKIGRADGQDSIDFGSDDTILFDIDNTERMRVDAAGVDITGALTISGATSLNGSAHLGDNDYIYFGADNDYSLGYVSGNYLAFAQSVNSSPFGIIFKADSGGDDAGDEWRMDLADGGVMSWGNDINSAHTYVTHFSCTPNSTVANSTFAMAGHATVGHDLTVSGDLAVTGSYGLAASDIPNLAASKITSGTFATARIADDAITTAKINDGDVTNAKLAGSIDDSKLSTITTTNKVHVAALDIDGATDIGEALADADLFIVDNGANSTERKSTMSRIKTYVLSDSTVTPASGDSFLTLDSDGSTTQRTTVDALATLLAGTNISASSGVLSATNTTYSEATSSSEGLMSTAHHDKLDGIEASADVTDTANVTAAGALMDSELTSLSHVKAINQGLTTSSNPQFGAISCTTINTGQGANELYDMNQNVLTTSDPTFADLTVTNLTANTAILPDASGGATIGNTNLEWGDMYIADDKYIYFGTDQDVKVGYDEDGDNGLEITAADGTEFRLLMNADNADDNADKWMLRIANGGLLSFDSYTSGSWVKKLKLNEANGALTINEAYTLPTTVTSQNDYVLTAQTDGTTAWAAASGGGGGGIDGIAIADESSDTTCFPLFHTAATGTDVTAMKTGTNLTFNSSTGLLDATKYAANGTEGVTTSGADHLTVVRDVTFVPGDAFLGTPDEVQSTRDRVTISGGIITRIETNI